MFILLYLAKFSYFSAVTVILKEFRLHLNEKVLMMIHTTQK